MIDKENMSREKKLFHFLLDPSEIMSVEISGTNLIMSYKKKSQTIIKHKSHSTLSFAQLIIIELSFLDIMQ